MNYINIVNKFILHFRCLNHWQADANSLRSDLGSVYCPHVMPCVTKPEECVCVCDHIITGRMSVRLPKTSWNCWRAFNYSVVVHRRSRSSFSVVLVMDVRLIIELDVCVCGNCFPELYWSISHRQWEWKAVNVLHAVLLY